MSIKQFFAKYSFWGILTLVSFCALVGGCLILIPVFIIFKGANLEWLINFLKWAAPILFAIFLLSSQMHTSDLKKDVEEAYRRTQNNKELESINKRMELLEKEKQLNEERLKIYEEMVEIRKLERDRLNQSGQEDQVE